MARFNPNVTPIDQVIDLSDIQPYRGNQYEPNQQFSMEHFETSSPAYGITTPAIATGGGVNCPSVMMHINSCPLCNKLYNPDRTLYILMIVILAVVCVILLKRAMDRD